MREYPFELALCAHLERERDVVVARQLGGGVEAPGNRVVDVVLVEPGPAFAERARLTAAAIPGAAIESDVGPGRARRPERAFDCSAEHARRVADRAVEVGFFEGERRGGTGYVRQVTRYPDDWFGRLLAVENKPDLGAPGDLVTQLRKDVSLGLFDAVVLATESHVTGAHLNRIPDAVGVWRVDADPAAAAPAAVEVVREPEPLAVDEPGVELLETHPGRVDVAPVDAAAKARTRRRVAERAYGKGWRPADLPACAEAAAREGALPYCHWKERLVDPAGCGPDCPGHEPADPPAGDPDAQRASRSPWVADPEGAARRQAGLDSFGE